LVPRPGDYGLLIVGRFGQLGVPAAFSAARRRPSRREPLRGSEPPGPATPLLGVPRSVESEDDLVDLLVASVCEATSISHAREAALLEDADGGDVVARRAGVERTGSLDPRQELVQRASRDPLAPVLPSDPVRHLASTVEVEARDVTHHSAPSFHDLVRRLGIASQPCPAFIERATVVRIRRREGRHPDRLAIRPVLEQHVQIPILDLAKYEVL
jgi:hypothetical protein